MPFSSFYLCYWIDRVGFNVDDITGMTTFYASKNGLFIQFRTYLMEERMKAIEHEKTDMVISGNYP
jgi:hypothetical protein